MSYQIILGASCLEITVEPSAGNSKELIHKTHVTGVFPLRYGITVLTNFIRIYFREGKTARYIDVDLSKVTNQPTWSGGTKADLDQALTDINAWLPGVVCFWDRLGCFWNKMGCFWN
jgi:hypothetical protein